MKRLFCPIGEKWPHLKRITWNTWYHDHHTLQYPTTATTGCIRFASATENVGATRTAPTTIAYWVSGLEY